jgi:hypothetical protein
MEAQAMKEPDADAFGLKLIKLASEANREFIKIKDLQAFLDENAEWLDKTCHTMTYNVTRSLVNHIAGLDHKDDLTGYGSAEILHRDYKNILAGLLDGDSNFMIRLLAERAALCWLHVQSAEYDRKRLNHCTGVQHYHIERAEKQITIAQNRFLRACAALTKARVMIVATELMEERKGKPTPRLALVAGQ